MAIEIEASFSNVDHQQLRQRLKTVGAELIQPMTLMRRRIFDYPDLRLDAQAAWLRLRDEGSKITLTYKQRQSETIDGMRELEVEVSDFDAASALLQALGLVDKAYQETKRETWRLDECDITLDEWPWIPLLCEVEGPSETAVRRAAQKLELDWEDSFFDSTDGIYIKLFDVTRTQISSTNITFEPIPEWLDKLRRT